MSDRSHALQNTAGRDDSRKLSHHFPPWASLILINGSEIGTERRQSWWLKLLILPEIEARDFVKAHAVKVADVMTRQVVTATESHTLGELASLLEKHGIKRVPIVQDKRVIGIVSRANLLQAFARASAEPARETTGEDQATRERIVEQIRALPWGMPWLLTVTVQDGVAELWGPVHSEEQRQAIRVAAERVPGVKAVKENLYRLPAVAE